jgi:hypothetical protein
MIDLWSSVHMIKNAPFGPKAYEATRKLMQAAAYVAMAFDEECAVTVTMLHEALDNIRSQAAPNTDEGWMTKMVANVVYDYACPRWTIRMTNNGKTTTDPDGTVRATTNDERDQFIVEDAHSNGIAIVSNDDGMRKRAARSGVSRFFAPEAYATTVLSFATAKQCFFERLDRGIDAYLARHGSEPGGNEHIALRRVYVEVWR